MYEDVVHVHVHIRVDVLVIKEEEGAGVTEEQAPRSRVLAQALLRLALPSGVLVASAVSLARLVGARSSEANCIFGNDKFLFSRCISGRSCPIDAIRVTRNGNYWCHAQTYTQLSNSYASEYCIHARTHGGEDGASPPQL